MKHGQLAIVDRDAYQDGTFTFVQHDEPHDFVLLGDNTFALLPDAIPDDSLITVCLHCLIDQHPHIGKALDIAQQHGRAILDDDWFPLD